MEELDIKIPPIKETIDKFSENALDGNGVFDILMHSAELHIHDEYDKNRITGANYSATYLKAMEVVLQMATQITLSADKAYLEALQAKYTIERLKLDIEKGKIDLDIAKIQLEVAKAQVPLVEAQVASEQAKTRDMVDNGEKPYPGSNTNVHGLFGWNNKTSEKAIDTQCKNDALTLAKETVITPFQIIESADGTNASYFGLNGGNGISILNNLRDAYGVKTLDIEKYSGDHKPYMDTYAPGASVEDDE